MDMVVMQRAINMMTLDQLREVNRRVCNAINEHHAQIQRRAAAKFKVGDLVEFTSEKLGRRIRLRIERINLKSLSGTEFNDPTRTWRVSPNLCRLVGAT